MSFFFQDRANPEPPSPECETAAGLVVQHGNCPDHCRARPAAASSRPGRPVRLCVQLPRGNNITGIDISTNAAFPIQFGNSSQGLIVSSDGSRVYTSDWGVTNTVTILSTVDNSVQHILLEASMGC